MKMFQSFTAENGFAHKCVVVFAVGLLSILAGCGGVGGAAPSGNVTPAASATGDVKSINHIIFTMQENRSFDSYFGNLPGVDGLPATASNRVAGNGALVNAFHFQTACIENADPDWLESHADFNLYDPGSTTWVGDGFIKTTQGAAKGSVNQAGFASLIAEVPNSMGSVQVVPHTTTNYYLFANADVWGAYDTKPLAVVSVTLTSDTQTPTPVAPSITPAAGVVFTASPTTVGPGQPVTLTWSVPGATTTMVNTRYDQAGVRAMGYYTGDDLNYYYFMAQAFATSDRWFSPISSNSPPNRSYLYAATTHGHAHDPGTFDSSVVKNLFQLLDAAGITWRVYYTVDPSNPTVPHTFLTRFQPFASQHPANLVPADQYFTDVQNGTLAQVSLIEELPGLDEHPGAPLDGNIHSGNNVQAGAQYMSKFINAFMVSQYWKDGVFILTFDEGGGFYEHVPPQPAVSPDGIPPMDLTPQEQADIQPPADFTRTGFRVPLIVISPYVKKGYVSHTVADFTAIDKFIETRFGLTNLTARDQAQMDMTEFFNFSSVQTPTPPSPPAQSMNLGCDYTNLPTP